MRLALSMICDELEHLHPGVLTEPITTYGRPRTSRSITLAPSHHRVNGVRIFDSVHDSNTIDPALLYIVEDRNTACKIGDNANVMLVCDELTNYSKEASPASCISDTCGANDFRIMTVTPGITAFELMEYILEIFEHFQTWHDAFMEAIIQNVSLDELLIVGCRFFRNPVSFTNPALENVTRAGAELPNDIAGSILETILEVGYSPFEAFGDEERDRLVLEIENAHSPYLSVPQQAYSDNSFLIAPVQDGNRLPPALTSTDVCEPFTEGQVELISLIASGVEAYLKLNQEQPQALNELALVIETLLKGISVNEERMLHALKRYRWGIDDDFLVALIPNSETPFIDAILSRIAMEIDQGLALTVDGQIIVVINCTRSESSDIAEQFSQMLSHMDLQGGVSCKESDFSGLARLYEQAKVAMETAVARRITGLVRFNEDYESCIVNMLGQQADLSALLNPAVNKLWQLEKSNILIETLRCFLRHGGNLTRTAQELFLHRSTLTYRLNKIESATGLNLKELSNNDIQALQISCMIAQYL